MDNIQWYKVCEVPQKLSGPHQYHSFLAWNADDNEMCAGYNICSELQILATNLIQLESLFSPILSGAKSVSKIHLWDEQQQIGIFGLCQWKLARYQMPQPDIFIILWTCV